MPNPLGTNDLFVPEPPYGDIARQQALEHEAPISGAPMAPPGIAAPQPGPAPAAASGHAPVPTEVMPVAPASVGGPGYYARLAATWHALAKTPGASPQVKAIAKQAIKIAETQHGVG